MDHISGSCLYSAFVWKASDAYRVILHSPDHRVRYNTIAYIRKCRCMCILYIDIVYSHVLHSCATFEEFYKIDFDIKIPASYVVITMYFHSSMNISRLASMSSWVFLIGSFLCLQEPIWALLGPTWPLGLLIITYAAYHRHLYLQDKRLSWRIPIRFIPKWIYGTHSTDTGTTTVNIRFWVLRLSYPLFIVWLAGVLGVHYASFSRKSFIYHVSIFSVSTSSSSSGGGVVPDGFSWTDVQWRDVIDLGAQLVWCNTELAHRWASDSQAFISAFSGHKVV